MHITIEKELLKNIDLLVAQGQYSSRSQAIQDAVKVSQTHWKRTRLFEALKRVNPQEERVLANERLTGESW